MFRLVTSIEYPLALNDNPLPQESGQLKGRSTTSHFQ